METEIRFGTDGWRGRIAEDYTFENVRRCAHGFAQYLLSKGCAGEWVVVGYDKRYASEHFATAASEVLAGNGLRVWLTNGATPTPVIAYAVVDKQAVGAVNITASHNPATDNGFKVRDQTGGAVDPDGLLEIEARIPVADDIKLISSQDATSQGLIKKFDAAPPYVEHLREFADLESIREAGFTVVVDAMWGNGAGWFPKLLNGGRTQVVEIRNIRNPSFPEMSRPEPIPPNIDVGLRKTVEHGADVYVVMDGDADRVGVGDENGQFINQLCVYGLLAYYLLEVRGERGPIVKTLSTTSMLNKLGEIYNVPVYETGVGFKYIAPKMNATNALIGGEESGGFAFRDHVPERDGILSGILILELMCKLAKKPSELIETLFATVGARYYYDRIDSEFPQGQVNEFRSTMEEAAPSTVGGLGLITVDKTDGYKFCLEGGSWVLVRFSGTEPIVRVYCETTEESRVQTLLQDGLRIAGLS